MFISTIHQSAKLSACNILVHATQICSNACSTGNHIGNSIHRVAATELCQSTETMSYIYIYAWADQHSSGRLQNVGTSMIPRNVSALHYICNVLEQQNECNKIITATILCKI